MTSVSECISVLLTFKGTQSSPTVTVITFSISLSAGSTPSPEPAGPPVLGLKQTQDSLAQLVGRGRLHGLHYHGRLCGPEGAGAVTTRVGGYEAGQFDPSVAGRPHQVGDAGCGVRPVADLQDGIKYEASCKHSASN